MTEPLRPAPAKTFGRKNWFLAQTVAGYASGTGPTVAEMTAVSTLDITRIAFADGAPAPTQSTNAAEQLRRWGDTENYQFTGTTTYAGGDMTYAMNPQGVAAADDVKLWEKLEDGGLFFLIRRLAVVRATAPTAGQFVDVFPADFGPSMPVESGDGENSEGAAVVTFTVYNKPLFRVAIVA